MFSEKLYELKKTQDYPTKSLEWLYKNIQRPTKYFSRSSINDLTIGSFYFAKYDTQGLNKSSKMEQFLPFMMVDYYKGIDSKVLYILNLNFLPLNTKEVFFPNYLDKRQKVLEYNIDLETDKQKPLNNVSYKELYAELLQYGFDYSIREIRVDLISELYQVSTNDLDKFITLNTQILTGVDEQNLKEIWLAKMKTESYDDRVMDILTIKNNYEKIVEELAEKFKNLNNGG